jgi:hypothetical protein
MSKTLAPTVGEPGSSQAGSAGSIPAANTQISRLIPVCSECLQASCWQYIFLCDEYRTAGVVYKTRAELKALNLEHPSYWKTDKQLAEE